MKHTFVKRRRQKRRQEIMREYHLDCASRVHGKDGAEGHPLLHALARGMQETVEHTPFDVWGRLTYTWAVQDEPFEVVINHHFINSEVFTAPTYLDEIAGAKYFSIIIRNGLAVEHLPLRAAPIDLLIAEYKKHECPASGFMFTFNYVIGVLLSLNAAFKQFECVDSDGEVIAVMHFATPNQHFELRVNITALKNDTLQMEHA
jgi:hypothetical protein